MSDTDQTNRLGVNILDQRVLESGHVFREQAISDSGIDAHIEIKDMTTATGRLIAVQIKSGPSYFSHADEKGFWHYVSDRHRELWINHSLPVIIVLCDVDKRESYYEIVSEETCLSTGEGWKIHIPKSKTIGAHSSRDLISIASPIAAASDFSVHAEQDQSHGLARRISFDVVVHSGKKPVNKPFLGSIVRATLKLGQSSQYHRDELSERALGGQPVDVVWGFVYLRDIDRRSTSWACRFQWVSPCLESSSRPCEFEGEQDGSGLVIDWNGRTELARYLDERRVTKSVYLKNVDMLLVQLPAVRQKLATLLERGDQSPHSENFATSTEKFESTWDGTLVAPGECQRLDQAIHELLATVGNVGLIWDQRNTWTQAQVGSQMRRCRDELRRLDEEVSFLRRDAR
nr:DUF4365 domain-containing protein [uncultured Cohaesibacter sp.]